MQHGTTKMEELEILSRLDRQDWYVSFQYDGEHNEIVAYMGHRNYPNGTLLPKFHGVSFRSVVQQCWDYVCEGPVIPRIEIVLRPRCVKEIEKPRWWQRLFGGPP